MRVINTVELPQVAAADVPTPAAGTITVFNESGVLKQKDSTGTVIDLSASSGGGGITHGQVLRRIELGK